MDKPIWKRDLCKCEHDWYCDYCMEYDKKVIGYIEYLEKENQELKDKFLKVVESVLNNHIHMNDKCSCFWESETDTFGEHLLQEIRKAMEND